MGNRNRKMTLRIRGYHSQEGHRQPVPMGELAPRQRVPTGELGSTAHESIDEWVHQAGIR